MTFLLGYNLNIFIYWGRELIFGGEGIKTEWRESWGEGRGDEQIFDWWRDSPHPISRENPE